jgi:hypothetical protein
MQHIGKLSRAGPAPSQVPGTYWSCSAADLLRALGTDQQGLSSRESAARLRRAGGAAPHYRSTELVLLLRQFANPTTLILDRVRRAVSRKATRSSPRSRTRSGGPSGSAPRSTESAASTGA